jgi:muramoyltetrapeptide carboxypeptidase
VAVGYCRREFLGGGAASLAALVGASRAEAAASLIKPPRLEPGDTVGLVNSVSQPLTREDADAVCAALEEVGLRVTCGSRTGAAVDDQERAREVSALFADPRVQAIVAVRGGWGSARLLPHLDYETIRRHPKVLMGFSDVGALLLGVHARTGLVTFHGPMGISSFVPYTVGQMRRVLFQGLPVRIGEAAETDRNRGPAEGAHQTLVPGRARGRLLGGNLTVLSSLVGSPYLGTDADLVLFLEDVREPLSEVSRMLTQLELAGVLKRVKAVVFGQCTRCTPPQADTSLTLDRVLREQIVPLGVPVWRGALIGHIERQLTLPIGVTVEVDSVAGTIDLLEPAVS